MKSKYNGFTLIEMVMTLAIVVITTVVAIGSYSSYTRRSRRADGINAMLSITLSQERYRSMNSTYGTLAQVWGGVSTSPEGYYTLSVSNVSATSYTITATAQGNQANDAANGTSCTTLTLAASNGTITKSPSACWPT